MARQLSMPTPRLEEFIIDGEAFWIERSGSRLTSQRFNAAHKGINIHTGTRRQCREELVKYAVIVATRKQREYDDKMKAMRLIRRQLEDADTSRPLRQAKAKRNGKA